MGVIRECSVKKRKKDGTEVEITKPVSKKKMKGLINGKNKAD